MASLNDIAGVKRSMRSAFRLSPLQRAYLMGFRRARILARRDVNAFAYQVEAVNDEVHAEPRGVRGEMSLDELSVVAGISRYHFAHDATIKACWKRIFALIREMLVVERVRQLEDCQQRTNPGNLGNFLEAYSPILQWLRGRD
jgi:hypothetical protein